MRPTAPPCTRSSPRRPARPAPAPARLLLPAPPPLRLHTSCRPGPCRTRGARRPYPPPLCRFPFVVSRCRCRSSSRENSAAIAITVTAVTGTAVTAVAAGRRKRRRSCVSGGCAGGPASARSAAVRRAVQQPAAGGVPRGSALRLSPRQADVGSPSGLRARAASTTARPDDSAHVLPRGDVPHSGRRRRATRSSAYRQPRSHGSAAAGAVTRRVRTGVRHAADRSRATCGIAPVPVGSPGRPGHHPYAGKNIISLSVSNSAP